jgi:hypothetical protein
VTKKKAEMSKKQHYYQIHKNKKPNKKLKKGLHPKVIECLSLAFEVVNKAIRRSQMLAYLSSQSIPKYKLGNEYPEFVSEAIIGDNKTEYIETIKGEMVKIPSPTDFDIKAKFDDKYHEMAKSIKEKVNYAAITADELLKSHEDFLLFMNKIPNSTNSFLNNKAPN